MTQALATVDIAPKSLEDTIRLAEIFAKSGFFQDSRDMAQGVTKIYAGAELGFGPIASMQGVYIVKGRVTLSANLIGAAIQRSGKYSYRIKELTNDSCTLLFRGPDNATFESTFTIKDAEQAGISGDTYKKFPRNMLFARALTNGARWFCPEVFSGPVYTPDELGAMLNDAGDVIDVSTGEVVEERMPDGSPPVDAQLAEYQEAAEAWSEACREADRLKIPHKELPADPPIEQIQRWTIALIGRINAAEREPEPVA